MGNAKVDTNDKSFLLCQIRYAKDYRKLSVEKAMFEQ